jgi:MtN3 and saliva related transmembrane protein
MDYASWIGLAAGALTTFCYVPQLKKVWDTRSTEDISLKMMLVLASGLALWTVFGVLRGEIAIVLANALSFAFAVSLIGLKLRFD